jgi:hypothetical protein
MLPDLMGISPEQNRKTPFIIFPDKPSFSEDDRNGAIVLIDILCGLAVYPS